MRKALKTSEVDTDLVSQALQLMTSTLTPIVESAVTFVANLCSTLYLLLPTTHVFRYLNFYRFTALCVIL